MSWAEIKKAVNSDLSTPLNEKINNAKIDINTEIGNVKSTVNTINANVNAVKANTNGLPKGLIQYSWSNNSANQGPKDVSATISNPNGGYILSLSTSLGSQSNANWARIRVCIDPTDTANPVATATKVYEVGTEWGYGTTSSSLTYNAAANGVSSAGFFNKTTSVPTGSNWTTNLPIHFNNKFVVQSYVYTGNGMANGHTYYANSSVTYAFDMVGGGLILKNKLVCFPRKERGNAA